ncbi:MAG: penicillin-binding protein 2 [Synergistes sp.]|nr:penicillin-binding protein 2 [Synergistes sp.]
MPRIRRREDNGIRKNKLVWVLVYLILLVLLLGTAKAHLVPDKRISQQSQKQYWANISEGATRGTITDRWGVPLAVSVPTTSFFIDPMYWDPASADFLAEAFGRETADKFSRPMEGRFHWVKRNLPKSVADRVIDKKIPGLYTVTEIRRNYPHDSLAFHLIGFCDIDQLGQAGVELEWNSLLYSPPRTRFVARDSHGRGVEIIGGAQAPTKLNASSMRLTIDSGIQQIMELRLAEGAKNADASWAAGVCVDPYTGEIIALASYPTLNPNKRQSLSDENAVRNNVVGRVFEPGSIFKPIVTAIALESGNVSRNSTFMCHGTMKLFDKTMNDVNKRAHGFQDVTHVIMNSCNIGMSLMSMRVPKYEAYGMLRQFGFGEKSDVEIAGEEAGLMKEPEEWLGTVPANIFIGQGIGVTPIQVVMAISSIVNGGKLLKPYVIGEVRDSYGNVVHKGTRRVRYNVMSEGTAAFLRHAMAMVVSEGGGKQAKSDKVRIAGKTGTAQIATSGQYKKGQYVASFAGFWPADKPKYVMVINIGEPKGTRYYGGQIAAPIFKAIAEDIVQSQGRDATRSLKVENSLR